MEVIGSSSIADKEYFIGRRRRPSRNSASAFKVEPTKYPADRSLGKKSRQSPLGRYSSRRREILMIRKRCPHWQASARHYVWLKIPTSDNEGLAVGLVEIIFPGYQVTEDVVTMARSSMLLR